MSVDYIHPVSGLRLLRAQLPAAERRDLQPIRIRDEPQDRDMEEEKKANAEHRAYHTRRCDEETSDYRWKFNCRRERTIQTYKRETEELQRKYMLRTKQTCEVLKQMCRDQGLKVSGNKSELVARLRFAPFEILDDHSNADLAAEHGKKLEQIATEYRNKMNAFTQDVYKKHIDTICTRRRELAWTCPNDGMAHPFTWCGRNYHREYNGDIWCLTDDQSGRVWRGKWSRVGYIRSVPPTA